MGTPYLGRGATVGLAQEVAWGTPVARTNWLRLVSESLERTIDRGRRPHLGTLGAASANRRSTFVRSDFVGGDIEIEMGYDDSTLFLLKQAMGAVADAGAGPFTHTFTLAEALSVGMTVERILGNGKANVFSGMLVDSFKLSGSVGEICRASFSLIGKTEAGRAAAGAPTYSPGGNPIIHHQAAATPLLFNAVSYDILSWEINVARNLTRRQLYGSKLTANPVRGDFEECTLRVTREYDADTPFAALVADTQGDAVLGAFTGTSNNAMTITAQNAILTSVSDAVSGPGIIQETAEFLLLSDATDEGLKIVITNGNATSIIN